LGQGMPADGGDAEATLTRFAQAGIGCGQLADDLQREGPESFVSPGTSCWRASVLKRLKAATCESGFARPLVTPLGNR
jgi:hypothetical protein